MIGDTLVACVEATTAPLGFNVTMLVCALLCCNNFWNNSISSYLLRWNYSHASCDYNWSLGMGKRAKRAIIFWFWMMVVLSKLLPPCLRQHKLGHWCYCFLFVTHSQAPGWTHLRVHQSVVVESWDSEGAPDFQHYKGVEGRARSLGIRLGRGTSRSSLNLHPKQTTKWLVQIPWHLWVLGLATGTLDHKTHHDPDSGETTTFPHIVFFATLRWGYIQMALFPGTPKLESRNCPSWSPGTLGAHNSRLQSSIATRYEPKL